MPGSLRGQKVVIIGGTSGIGFGVAQGARADGADVIHVAQEPAEADGVAERGTPQLDRGLGHPVQHLGG